MRVSNRRRRAWCVAMGLVVAVWASSAGADIPVPGSSRAPRPAPNPGVVEQTTTNGQQAPFVVRFDRRQQQSRIVIPRKYLQAAAPAAGLNEAAPQALQRRSIVAGIMLSAVIAGGFLAVVFVRRRKFALGAAAGLSVAAALVVLGGVALADIAVPKQASPPPVVRPATDAAHQIVVETTDTGEEVVLIVGRDGLPTRLQLPYDTAPSDAPRRK